MTLMIFTCNPHEALERHLAAETVRQVAEHELELDLERELELAEPLEVEVEVLDSAVVLDWDAYV